MDVTTQILLGAAVGEATLGKRIGHKAMFLGAIAGWMPDWDTLAHFFMSDINAMYFHRGFMHSLPFALLMAPILAWLSHRYLKKKPVSFPRWTLFYFLCIFTHPLLDAFTSFGTQLLNPFTTARFNFNGVFFIDPLYSLPLLFLIIGVLFIPFVRKRRQKFSLGVLAFTTAFLLFNSVIIQPKMKNRAYSSLEFKGKNVERVSATPLPLSLQWHLIAEDDSMIYYCFTSIGTKASKIDWKRVKKNHHLAEKFQIQDAYEFGRLRWFSKDWFVLEEVEGQVHFHDLRFPKFQDFGLGQDDGTGDQYIFSFALSKIEDDIGLERNPAPDFNRIDLFRAVGNFIVSD